MVRMTEKILNKIDLKQGILNVGNLHRIHKVMEKAKEKKPITVAFIGGSITQGSVSSTPETCYAYLTYLWWKQQYPQTPIQYVNAGIGGTDSYLGAARVTEEVLQYNPDFVVVEFSVNDSGEDPHCLETYEGLLRQILKVPEEIAVLIVCNVQYDSGENAQKFHLQLAKYYDLPAIGMKETIYQTMIREKIPMSVITPDCLHPNDVGHALVAKVICFGLEQFKTMAENKECSRNSGLLENLEACENESNFIQPMTANHYETARRLRNYQIVPSLCDGFVADDRESEGYWDHFVKGYMADKAGEKIEFSVECKCLAVQYRKTIQKGAPKAKLVVDGDEAMAMVLDGNFHENWGDCLYLQPIFEKDQRQIHTVSLEILEDGECAFYLLSLLIA